MARPQVLFSNIDYDDYVGRIGIGRVERGTIQVGTRPSCSAAAGRHHPEREDFQAVSV